MPETSIRSEASTLYEEQVACSVAYKLVSHVPDSIEHPLVLYTGEDYMERFMKDLIDIENNCVDYFYRPPNILSNEAEKLFNTSLRCTLCSKTYGQEKGMTKFPYVDFCSAEYLGAIHLKCHEERARKMSIPVFFHHFRAYDSHLVVRALGVDKNRKLDIIGQ